MSQAPTASRGSAARMESRRPRSSSCPWSASPRWIRLRVSPASRAPSPRRSGTASVRAPEDSPGVADEPKRLVGRADPLGIDVDLDDAAAGPERVLARGLCAELGTDAEEHVGGAHAPPGTRLRRRPSRGRADGLPGRRPCPCRSWRQRRRAAPPAPGARSRRRRGARRHPAQITGRDAAGEERGRLRDVGERRLDCRGVEIDDARRVGLGGQQVDWDLEERPGHSGAWRRDATPPRAALGSQQPNPHAPSTSRAVRRRLPGRGAHGGSRDRGRSGSVGI